MSFTSKMAVGEKRTDATTNVQAYFIQTTPRKLRKIV
jgi:hypothetical protein